MTDEKGSGYGDGGGVGVRRPGQRRRPREKRPRHDAGQVERPVHQGVRRQEPPGRRTQEPGGDRQGRHHEDHLRPQEGHAGRLQAEARPGQEAEGG